MDKSLNSYKWKNRVIIVKGNASDIFEKQYKIARANESVFKERKLIVLQAPNNLTLFESNGSDNVFLVGLDGNVKVSSTNEFSVNELIDIIDSMPMRSNEMTKNL